MSRKLYAVPGRTRKRQRMVLVGFLSLLFYLALPTSNTAISEDLRSTRPQDTKRVPQETGNCPNYIEYSKQPHYDSSLPRTPLNLPRQRPSNACRTFRSDVIEKFLAKFVPLLKDPDVAVLFENTFPNTLDTSILWHSSPDDGSDNQDTSSGTYGTFIVTGDIHAEWLRDSAWQLSVYQPFLKKDKSLRELFRWAIYTQSVYIRGNPYCNAFQPPPGSNVTRGKNGVDNVTPFPDWSAVFECKYEIDSLASFLQLSYQFYSGVPKGEQFRFVTREWLLAVEQILNLVERESTSTFSEDGFVNIPPYTFMRWTTSASETLAVSGTGNPVNFGTGLVRSAFRPSDDATIFQFFVPGNAFLAVELEHLVIILQEYLQYSYSAIGNRQGVDTRDINMKELINKAGSFAKSIRSGIMEHAVVEHPQFGKVFAYEVDGYGSSLLMDDANIPSLLSLPDLGFIDVKSKIYQNTRSMILSNKGNPYFINGPFFQGIGGPHIGLRNPWPMSQIVRMRTSNDDEEIKESLKLVLENTGGLGLIHESVDGFVGGGVEYTRSWFAWANSEFAKSIIDLATRKPHLVFNSDTIHDEFSLENFVTQL